MPARKVTLPTVKFGPEKIKCKGDIVPIDSVKPCVIKLNPKDAKKLKAAIPRLAALFTRHGQRTPLSVWNANNVIYKGNATWYGLKYAGFTHVAISPMDFANEADAVSYGLSDNNAATWVGYDHDKLAMLMQSELVQSLGEGAAQKVATGLDDKEYTAFMMHTKAMPGALPDVDLQGKIDGKEDFVVIQFNDRANREEFLTNLGIKVEHQRVVLYELLMSKLTWTDPMPGPEPSVKIPPAKKLAPEQVIGNRVAAQARKVG